MIVCGLGGTVAQRTIIETGEFFGWIGVRKFEYISVFNLFFSYLFFSWLWICAAFNFAKKCPDAEHEFNMKHLKSK